MIDTIKINKEEVAIKDLTADNIIEWCVANGEREWIKSTCPEGTDITFFQLKTMFLRKFFPEAFKGDTKKITFLDKIRAL